VKRLKAGAIELAERLELPSEALGAVKVTVTGGKSLLAENHAGILEYGSERIVLSCGRGRLVISGSALALVGISPGELAVRGSITAVEWE